MAKDFNCGCSNGRTYLIDPNKSAGNGLDGTFVPPEDLNIYVELSTTSKSRSVISVDSSSKLKTENITKGKNKIKFIGGDKESLTTSYTDLTTAFYKNADTEHLGITSIDINFNASYVPLINIKFVDVRGSAVFAHGNDSPYSVFFELPYPIFELKVKGYFGKPVKYCLHLTKWKSNFNSQTGNFEISADFIGYTYAMLTDMLLGYIRAITQTPRGIVKFNEMKEELANSNGSTQESVESFITISDLLDRIELVNKELEKIKSTDADILELAKNKDVTNALTNVEELLLDKITSIKKAEKSDVMDTGDGLFAIRTPSGSEQSDLFGTYQKEVKAKIEKLNKEDLVGKIKLDIDDYTTSVKQYTNISLAGITKNTPKTRNMLSEGYSKAKYDNFRAELEGELKGNINPNDSLTVYDFRSGIKAIADTKNKVEANEVEVKKAVGKKAEEIVNKTLKFRPTIRNVFNIFTTHVEIFLECLKDVSLEADLDANGYRAAELGKLDKGSYDVHKDAEKIYPWPLYRKQKGKGTGFEEAYLGAEPIITNNRVPELVFVDDILKGLIKVNASENDRLNASILSSGENWFAINPLDTSLFTNNGLSSWSDLEVANNGKSSRDDIFRMMLVRGFTLFGLNNQKLRGTTIESVGASEGAAAYNFLLNKDPKDVVSNFPSDSSEDNIDVQVDAIISKFLGNVDSKGTKPTIFMKEDGSDYVYNWIIESSDPKNTSGILPFNGNYDRTPFYNGTTDTLNYNPENTWSVDNKDGILFTQTIDGNKPEVNGGLYLRILDTDVYTNGSESLPTFRDTDSYKTNEIVNNTTQDGENLVLLNDLSNAKLGTEIPSFNVYQGKYKTQELFQFKITNGGKGRELSSYNPESISSVPVFFKDGLVSGFYINSNLKETVFSTSLAEKNNPINKIEYNGLPVGQVVGGLSNKTRTTGVLAPNHGEDRKLWKKAQENVSDIWVPDIQFACEMDGNDSGEVKPFSLFGSQLYFEQRRSSSPYAARAFLFLHTLPWNGLTNAGSELEGIFDRTDEHFTLQNIFGRRPAFIKSPRAWAAFIGGILWRYDGKPIVTTIDQEHTGGSGLWDPIIWGNTDRDTPTAIPQDSNGNTNGSYSILGNGNSEVENTNNNLLNTWDNNNCWTKTGGVYNYKYFSESFLPKPDYVKSGSTDQLWQQMPRRNEFLTSTQGAAPFQFSDPLAGTIDTRQYKPISDVLLNLPKQVKEEFKKEFFKFVNGDWNEISGDLEIFPKSWDNINASFELEQGHVEQTQFSAGTELWKATYTSITDNDDLTGWSDTILNKFNIDNLKGSYDKITKGKYYSEETYVGEVTIGPRSDLYPVSYNYLLTNKQQSKIQATLRSVFTSDIVIANGNPKIWVNSDIGLKDGLPSINKDDLKLYIKSFMSVFKEYNGNNDEIKDKAEDEAKQEIFNTMDDNTIRLNIYRHCKAIYDKWVGGSDDEMMFSCGDRPKRDKSIATALGRNKPKLIDSFRFVSRGFNDIGDDFLINPVAISSILTKNYNQSFYDLISRVLADNNFNFIPLPTYIDYNADNMCDMFEANVINQDISDDVSGPSFVCVYAGQTSNKLDLGKNSDYPNDGFDLQCDNNGNLIGAPSDFTTEVNDKEHNIPVFMVNYGHENQNIFKDIKLDQSEFAETDESLIITDNIANSASHSNRTFAGQNLWNVYQMRAYSTEIESLGNPQIQPMMYFQLNSIPMFHGAYMIINVNHKITPNHMTTTFKGNRTRYVETPLMEAETLYMSLLGGLSDVDGSESRVGSKAIPSSIGYIGNDQQPPVEINYNHIRLKRD